VPKITGTTRSGSTKKRKDHENPDILIFKRTSPKADKGWRDAVKTVKETGVITQEGFLSLIRS
jgi:hypothetical protein